MTITALLLFAMTGAAHAQIYSVLYNLGTNSGDPLNPSRMGLFAQGRDGNLYSTTQFGGAKGFGTVFQLTPSGNMTVLHSFDGTNGAQPSGGLTLGADGDLYGTTYTGQSSTVYGTVFKITTGGTFTILHTLNGVTEGMLPQAPPVQGTDGNFYGTTSNGNGTVFGTAYKMTPSGNLTILHTFDTSLRYPFGLMQGADGNFYGTTRGGGTSNFGTVFKMTPQGAVTVLHSFIGTDGQFPDPPIIQANDGNFYGTTDAGGSGLGGVVYRITPAGVLTDLFNFANNGFGMFPYAGLVQATDGKFYGAANIDPGVSIGLLFQITSTGTYTVLINFTNVIGAHPGAGPQVALIQHTNGILYGDTNAGGSAGKGVLYSLDVGARPFVSLLPNAGQVGKVIQLLGQGFFGTTKVTFNGTPAIFHVASDTFLIAVVPDGAKTGLITVTTPSGTLASNKAFHVRPQITSFDPASGPVGTSVTITGVSLTQTTNVYFSGVKATAFTVNSDSQVAATVPAGAQTGTIVITTPGGAASSATSFTVTP